jgi:GT2 family glycosyltransferase
MTVHVVMPVFNRLSMTQAMLKCLSQQQVDQAINVIVIDDGSTDGTAQYLASLNELTVLHGDGNLWWGGAVDLAVQHIFTFAKDDDWILLVNNDTQIKSDFIQSLLNTANANPKSAAGSVIRNQHDDRLMSIGPSINAFWLSIKDRLNSNNKNVHPDAWEVDALSGRGVLLPVAGLKSIGGMRPKWLPHYLADYEVSLRLKSHGWQLIVSKEAAVYSEDEYGSQYRPKSLREKYWSVRSPLYLPALILFWWEASTWLERLTLPIRIILFMAFPGLRKNK